MKRFSSSWPLIILVILGIVVPWHWFADGRLIAGGDHLFYYNPTGAFAENFFTWINRINFGEPNYAVAFLFPFLSFFKLFGWLGFSPLTAESLWAIGLFLLPGVFMFLLVKELLPEGITWRAGGALVAALFYMFNPYIMTDMLQISQRPVQMVLPLLFLLWHRGLSLPAARLKYSLLFALATLLTASTGTAPAFLAIIPLALFLYTVFYGVFYRPSWRHLFLFIVQTAIFCLIFNLWWLVPAATAYQESGAAFQKSLRAGDYTKATPLWEAFRLMGFWAFRIEWGNKIPHIPYAHYYYEPLFLSISYLIVALGFLGMLVKKRLNKQLFFASLFLLGVFLSKGANPPLGEFYKWLFENLPLFALFREPFSKLTSLSLFALAVLLGLSWGKVSLFLGSRWRYFTTLLLIAIVLIYSFPILTGQVIQDPSWHGITRDSLHVAIPPAWYDIGRWFAENDLTGRVILFPKSGYGVCYNWTMGTCAGQPMARVFVPNPTIRFTPTVDYLRDQVVATLYDALFHGGWRNINPALGFLGIPYILQQNDLDWRHSPPDTYTPGEVKNLLERNGLKVARSFGQLDLYKVPNSLVYPLLYPTNDFSLVFGGVANFGKLLTFREPSFPESFYFADDRMRIDKNILESLRRLSQEIVVFPQEKERGELTANFPEAGFYNVYFLPEGESRHLEENLPEEIKVLSNTTPGLVWRKGSGEERGAGNMVNLGQRFFRAGEAPLVLSFRPVARFYGEELPEKKKTQLLPSTVGTTRRLTLSSAKPLPSGHYRLAFSYVAFGGGRVNFVLKHERCEVGDDCDYYQILEGGLPASAQPAVYQGEFTLYPPAKNITLELNLSTAASSGSGLEIQELRMVRDYRGSLVFVRENSGKVAESLAVPTLSFKRRDPTFIRVNVQKTQSPYFLVFSESFSRNWRATLVSPTGAWAQKGLPSANHFVVNGYANGWYVVPPEDSPGGGYDIILAYQPQRLLLLSFVVSLLGISVSLIYLLIRRTYA